MDIRVDMALYPFYLSDSWYGVLMNDSGRGLAMQAQDFSIITEKAQD